MTKSFFLTAGLGFGSLSLGRVAIKKERQHGADCDGDEKEEYE
jgi:hypothetical protein